MVRKRKVNYHTPSPPGADYQHYFVTDPDKDDSVVVSISGRYSPEKITHYFDESELHGYNRKYLTSLIFDSDEVTSRAADRLVYGGHKDDPTKDDPNNVYDMSWDEAKSIVDEHPRETLWHVSPEKLSINDAFSSRGYGPQVMTTLGIMHSRHPGAVIEADSILSQHSSKLARHAKAMGFPVVGHQTNPEMEVISYSDFSDTTAKRTSAQKEEDKKLRVSDEDVQRGQAVLKSYLSKQFDARKESERKRQQDTPEWRHSQGIYMLPGFGDED